jgi:hypothetical protein
MPRLRPAIALGLALGLVAAPAAARADLLGCTLGPSDLNRCTVSGAPAVALGAIAAPILVAGAAVSIAHELQRRTEERAAEDAAAAPVASTSGKHAPPSLALVPDPPDPYRAPEGKKETRHKPNAAFQFNDTATNVATAVTGAMVVGAVIATIVHDAHGSGHK